MKIRLPKNLIAAAESLKTNLAQRECLSEDQKGVLRILTDNYANWQDYILRLGEDGGWVKGNCANVKSCIYRLSSDVQILPEQTWWEKEGFILCDVEQRERDYLYRLPDDDIQFSDLLPALLRLVKGFIQVGWAYEETLVNRSSIVLTPVSYINEDGMCDCYLKGTKRTIAKWSVWEAVNDGH
jgi:hypothetical protein